MKKTALIVAAAFLGGVMLAGKVRALPLLNKLPAL